MVLYFILDFLYIKKRSISSHLVSPLFSLPSSILCFPPTSNVNVFRHLHNNCSINCLFQQSSCFEQKSLKADVSNNFIFQIIRAEDDHLLSLNLISSPDQQSEPRQPGGESGIMHLTPVLLFHPFFTLIDSFSLPNLTSSNICMLLLICCPKLLFVIPFPQVREGEAISSINGEDTSNLTREVKLSNEGIGFG